MNESWRSNASAGQKPLSAAEEARLQRVTAELERVLAELDQVPRVRALR